MPDKRLKGATEYSTHPPTLRVRQRLMNLSPVKRAERSARLQEYNSVRACCARVSKHEEYRRANVSGRRAMLLSHIRVLLDKRYVQTTTSPVQSGEIVNSLILTLAADARPERAHPWSTRSYSSTSISNLRPMHAPATVDGGTHPAGFRASLWILETSPRPSRRMPANRIRLTSQRPLRPAWGSLPSTTAPHCP